MPASSAFQTNFNGGEWSSKMSARIDIQKYHNSMSINENYIPIPQGPNIRRPGTRFVAEVKDSTKVTRLINFEYSTTQAYIIEFSDQFLRFYREEGQILSGGSPYEIASPYLEAELYELQFAQSADTLYIVHPNHAPRKLTRSAHTSWTLTTITFTDPDTLMNAAGKYPSAVAFYEERAIWAGGTDNPQRVIGSVAGDFENLTVGTNADDAFNYTLASNDVSVIRWLDSHDTLLIGTTGGVFEMTGSSIESAITPTSVKARRRSRVACSTMRPVRSEDNPLIYIQNTQRKLREFVYDYTINGYFNNDLNLLHDEIAADGIKEIAMQFEPYPVLWAVTNDGNLLSCTYQRDQQVVAWSRHPLGGSGIAESVSVIPSPNDDHDQLWLVVKRTINATTERYVEFMEEFPDLNTVDVEDTFYVDSGLTYDGAATTTLTGLGHLEGETVWVLANGANHPSEIVSSGGITLDDEYTKAQVGLPMPSKGRTLRLSPTHIGVRTDAKRTRVYKIWVRLWKSSQMNVGVEEGDTDVMPFRNTDDLMDTPVPLFTGDLEVEFDGDWEDDNLRIYFEQNTPLPSNVQALIYEMVVN